VSDLIDLIKIPIASLVRRSLIDIILAFMNFRIELWRNEEDNVDHGSQIATKGQQAIQGHLLSQEFIILLSTRSKDVAIEDIPGQEATSHQAVLHPTQNWVKEKVAEAQGGQTTKAKKAVVAASRAVVRQAAQEAIRLLEHEVNGWALLGKGLRLRLRLRLGLGKLRREAFRAPLKKV
jgi:hypothetical protein